MPQIDYAALAAQARKQAPVDYAVLADEARKVAPKTAPQPRSLLSRSTPDDFPVVELAKGVFDAVKQIPAGIYSAVTDPIGTVQGIGEAQGRVGVGSKEAFDRGDYLTAARKGANYLMPLLGPALDASTDKRMRGEISTMRMVGDTGTNAYLTAAGMRPRGPVVPRAAAPATREAALAKWGLEHGVPVDVASATANPIPRAAQKISTHTSLSGAAIGTKAAKARAESLATVGEQLASKGYASAATRETAGTAARAGVESSIRGFDDAANTHYGKLRELEGGSDPVELVTKREAIATDPKVVDRRFILRWLADDLTEMSYQPASRTRGARGLDDFQAATSAEEARQAAYSPRVAGSPVQDTLNLAGVSGTKGELAERISKQLQTGKIDKRLEAVADAYAEAWDGERFDFDLVTKETLTKAGIPRRALRSPMIGADRAEPGASRYYPDSDIPEVPMPVTTKAIQAPVDLASMRPSLKPVLDRLIRKKELVGTLQGAEARAATALDRLVNGEDFASLADVDAALGDLKSMSRGASMPELRSAGQGAAAFAVQKLDKAVMDAAQKLGPEAVTSLKEGRKATIQKYAAAEVLDSMNNEPVKTVNAATAPKDAAVMHLRELQRYAPDSLPQVGKAVLSEMLGEATKRGGFESAATLANKWRNLGTETKRLLFRDAEHVKDLDSFWALAEKMGENPNPSGSAYVGGLIAHGSYLLTDPVTRLGYEIGGATLAKALSSPAVTRAMLEGVKIPIRSKALAAAKYARLTNLIAQSAGISRDAIPAFAGGDQPPTPSGTRK